MTPDIEELKRLHSVRGNAPADMLLWAAMITDAFPAIIARLEAAERLRDAGSSLAKTASRYLPDYEENPLVQDWDAALAAFDKEQP